MNFENKPKTDREYVEMLYSLLTEMNGALMSQVRNINNTMSKILLNMIDIQNSLNVLNTGLKDTRDKRYQEEIDALESRIETMRREVEEKKVAKNVAGQSTSQEMRTVAMDVLTQQREAEIKRKQIDWFDVRNKVIPYIVGALVLAFVIYGLPKLGELLILIFSKK